jgi:hypothetical protein
VPFPDPNEAGIMGTAAAGITCMAAVFFTYRACVFESACAVSCMERCSLIPASASAVENARRNEWKSARLLVGVS